MVTETEGGRGESSFLVSLTGTCTDGAHKGWWQSAHLHLCFAEHLCLVFPCGVIAVTRDWLPASKSPLDPLFLSAASRPFPFCDDRSGLSHLLTCIVARTFFLFSFFLALSQEPSFPFWRVATCDHPPPNAHLAPLVPSLLHKKRLHCCTAPKKVRERKSKSKKKEPRPDHTGQTTAGSLLLSIASVSLSSSFSLSDSFAPLPLFTSSLVFPILSITNFTSSFSSPLLLLYSAPLRVLSAHHSPPDRIISTRLNTWTPDWLRRDTTDNYDLLSLTDQAASTSLHCFRFVSSLCFVVLFPGPSPRSLPGHLASPRLCVLFSFSGCPRPPCHHILSCGHLCLFCPSLSCRLCLFLSFLLPSDLFILSPLLPRAHPCPCLPTARPPSISNGAPPRLCPSCLSLARSPCLDPRQQQLSLAEKASPWSGWWLQNCHPPEKTNRARPPRRSVSCSLCPT